MVDFDDLDVDVSKETTKEQMKAEEIQKNAHMANGGESLFKCPSCNGTGTFYSYSGRAVGNCFKCKGKGKVSKRVAAAAKAKVTREENLAKRQEELRENHGEMIDFIWRNAEWSDFYRSMQEAFLTYGRFTEKQFAAIERGMEKAKERAKTKAEEKEAKAEDVDVSVIHELFDRASESGLKKPKFRTDVLEISKAPMTGRNAGSLYVIHDGNYAGKITNGKFFGSSGEKEITVDLIKELAKDPLEVAKMYGKKTGTCCCCGRELTDPNSIAAGIGPICESNWF